MPVAFDDSEFAFRKRLITVGFMHHAPRKKCDTHTPIVVEIMRNIDPMPRIRGTLVT